MSVKPASLASARLVELETTHRIRSIQTEQSRQEAFDEIVEIARNWEARRNQPVLPSKSVLRRWFRLI